MSNESVASNIFKYLGTLWKDIEEINFYSDWYQGENHNTRWFKYDRDWRCVNKSQFVPVIFEPPCIYVEIMFILKFWKFHSKGGLQ
jgi:hypothetical protein